jgi:hypothetical protein
MRLSGRELNARDQHFDPIAGRQRIPCQQGIAEPGHVVAFSPERGLDRREKLHVILNHHDASRHDAPPFLATMTLRRPAAINHHPGMIRIDAVHDPRGASVTVAPRGHSRALSPELP